MLCIIYRENGDKYMERLHNVYQHEYEYTFKLSSRHFTIMSYIIIFNNNLNFDC